MTFLPDEFLLTLLEKNKIADEFRNFGLSLNPCDRGFSCNCPFHSETGNSCIIYPDTHNFYCSGCGAGGDVITFLMKKQEISYNEAVQELALRCGLQVPGISAEEAGRIQNRRERCYEINRETANFYYQNLLKGSDRRGLAYFRERQLTPQTIQKYGLGYAPDDWHQLYQYLSRKGFSDEELLLANVCRRSEKGNIYDNFRNRVIFPIVDMHHHVIGFGGRVLDDSKPKYLNTSDTPVFDKGRNLFSLHFAGQHIPCTLILAEGYMDVIALHQAGFPNAVATLGTAITPQQARLMRQYADKVIISYDNDSAGQNATNKAIQHFRDVGLPAEILHIDGDAKDPDEYIRKFGAERFRLLLKHAQNVTDFQIDRCRNGLDLHTDAGEVMYLRRVAQVISEIHHEKEREIYIRRIAEELEIRPEVLKQQTNIFRNRRKKNNSNQTFHNAEILFHTRDEINPEAQTHLAESKNEELLLGCLIWLPEQFETIRNQVRPEDFVTDFHKRIYVALCEKIPVSTWLIPSLLGNAFSAEEMGRITKIFIYYRDKVNIQTVSDCIANLHSQKTKMADASNMSNDDLLQVIANKKKNIRLQY
ncbi:MAG: DNA primase [Oscillospiraceae bacterium]|nr:DNA primase [Oscillospiraceae bacterium]